MHYAYLNILATNNYSNWYELVDKESGRLKKEISKTISIKSGDTIIEDIFMEIVEMRNRIIHGFLTSSDDGEPMLATKTRVKDGNNQFIIKEEYLMTFIIKNEELSDLLYNYRQQRVLTTVTN